MNTCESCYFWHPEHPQVDAANCIVDPPRVLPLIGQQNGKPVTTLQNVYPTTRRDDYCHHFDPRPRPVIKITSQMPGEGRIES